MDVGVDVLRAVELHDPIHGGEIDTSRSDICAEESRVLSLNELEIDGGTLGLLLPSVKLKDLSPRLQPLESLISKAHLFT